MVAKTGERRQFFRRTKDSSPEVCRPKPDLSRSRRQSGCFAGLPPKPHYNVRRREDAGLDAPFRSALTLTTNCIESLSSLHLFGVEHLGACAECFRNTRSRNTQKQRVLRHTSGPLRLMRSVSTRCTCSREVYSGGTHATTTRSGNCPVLKCRPTQQPDALRSHF